MGTDAFLGAKAALLLGDRLALILRDDIPTIPWPAHWDLPGGGREGDETPWQTLAREVDEELGLDIGPAEVLWRAEMAAAQGPGRVWFYALRLPRRAVRNVLFGDEGSAWGLVSPDRALALPKLVPVMGARLRAWHAAAGGWGPGPNRA